VPTDSDRGVYGISVAAELTGTGIQNIRLYEARGLLAPDRTAGGTRRYSDDDLDRLRRIRALLEAGLNLAGIAMVLALEGANADLESANTALTADNTALTADNADLSSRNAALGGGLAGGGPADDVGRPAGPPR
jgi:MerR family transcriptional regulator, heat shock protein HspR